MVISDNIRVDCVLQELYNKVCLHFYITRFLHKNFFQLRNIIVVYNI